MKIQVIDIRKYPADKVVEYWKSKGGFDIDRGKDTDYPYVGIDEDGDIAGWSDYEVTPLPTSEPQFIVGQDYTMRNGKNAKFMGVTPDGQNVFYHYDDKNIWKYDGCNFDSDYDQTQHDIILKSNTPREFWVNEYPGGFEIFLTEEDAKEYVEEGCVKSFRVQEIIE
jgi:hypothetical protein